MKNENLLNTYQIPHKPYISLPSNQETSIEKQVKDNAEYVSQLLDYTATLVDNDTYTLYIKDAKGKVAIHLKNANIIQIQNVIKSKEFAKMLSFGANGLSLSIIAADAAKQINKIYLNQKVDIREVNNIVFDIGVLAYCGLGGPFGLTVGITVTLLKLDEQNQLPLMKKDFYHPSQNSLLFPIDNTKVK